MDRKRVIQRNGIGWGIGLWLFGYILSILFSLLMPLEMIRWFVTPISVVATCIVLWKWVHVRTLRTGFIIGAIWCALAVILDYLFIVMLLSAPSGHYQLDAYLYYASLLLLPAIAVTLRQKPMFPE